MWQIIKQTSSLMSSTNTKGKKNWPKARKHKNKKKKTKKKKKVSTTNTQLSYTMHSHLTNSTREILLK